MEIELLSSGRDPRPKKPSAKVLEEVDTAKKARKPRATQEEMAQRKAEEAKKAQEKADKKREKLEKADKKIAEAPTAATKTNPIVIEPKENEVSNDDQKDQPPEHTPAKSEPKEKKKATSEIKPRTRWSLEDTTRLIDAVAEFNKRKKTNQRLQSLSATKKWLTEIPKIIAELGGIARQGAPGGSLSACPNKGRFDLIAGEAKDYINHKNVVDGAIFERKGKEPPTGAGMEDGDLDFRMEEWTKEQDKKAEAKRKYFTQLSEEKKQIYEHYWLKFPLTATAQGIVSDGDLSLHSKRKNEEESEDEAGSSKKPKGSGKRKATKTELLEKSVNQSAAFQESFLKTAVDDRDLKQKLAKDDIDARAALLNPLIGALGAMVKALTEKKSKKKRSKKDKKKKREWSDEENGSESRDDEHDD